jgi:hypothetical protein
MCLFMSCGFGSGLQKIYHERTVGKSKSLLVISVAGAARKQIFSVCLLFNINNS